MGARVLWVAVLGLLFGVFLRSFLPLGFSFVGFAALLAVAIFALSLAIRKERVGVVVAVALLALGGGIVRMDAAILAPDLVLEEWLGEEITIKGVVFDEPDIRETSTRLSVRLESGTGVLAVAPAHTSVSYGDRVRLKGTLRAPEAFEAGLGREFNYPAFLAKSGIQYELSFVREVEVIGRGGANPIKAAAIWTKQTFLRGLGLALPEPHAGLAGGITVGDKRGLGEELSEIFRTVSLTHIVVLSGYNIMIVIYALAWIFERSRAPRAVEFFGAVFIACLFALMTGLAAASVRAAAMASIAALGKITSRQYLASRALAVVALGMVLWNPYILAFDPGFQLSIAATWGLIAFSPLIAPRLWFLTHRWGFREIAATTIAAQLAVLPLLLYQTGTLSIVALPANLLVLVVVPWAMFFSTIAALAGLAFGPLASIIALPAYALLGYMTSISSILASVPFAAVPLPAFSAWWLVVIYGIGLLLLRGRGTIEAYGKS